MAAPDQPGDRDNAGPDCHIECARVEAEIPDEDLLSHFIADIVVWPVEDAQHIDAAHNPDHPAPSSTTGSRFARPVIHSPGRGGHAVQQTDGHGGRGRQFRGGHAAAFALPAERRRPSDALRVLPAPPA